MEEGAYDQVIPKMEPEMAPMVQDEPEMEEYEYVGGLMEGDDEEY